MNQPPSSTITNVNTNLHIMSSYQSYLSLFSKDYTRSHDNIRIDLYSKSCELIKQHNEHKYNSKPDPPSTTSSSSLFLSLINPESKAKNPQNSHQIQNQEQLYSTTNVKSDKSPKSTNAFFLRENQFSDLTVEEINQIFIQNAPTFDSIVSKHHANRATMTNDHVNTNNGAYHDSHTSAAAPDQHNKHINENNKYNQINTKTSRVLSSYYHQLFDVTEYVRQTGKYAYEFTHYNNHLRGTNNINNSNNNKRSLIQNTEYYDYNTLHYNYDPSFDNQLATSHKSKNSDSNPSTSTTTNTNTVTYTSLNWATSNNPKQRSILPSGIRNQGLCGACWAFVATSSVEASISKNYEPGPITTPTVSPVTTTTAAAATMPQSPQMPVNKEEEEEEEEADDETKDTTDIIPVTAITDKDNGSSGSSSKEDTSSTSSSEGDKSDSTTLGAYWKTGSGSSSYNLYTLSLSVQELIDCDTEYDRGCSGGNPVNAFRYIMVHGLTTSDKYPLDIQKSISNSGGGSTSGGSSGSGGSGASVCRSTESDPVRGAIKGFIAITPFREDLILQSLVNQGPISVGICGTDVSFLYYGGGIYNPEACCTTLNHALLLIGYGTDAATGMDYWIAQNSWGSVWGESGYIRLLRHTTSSEPHAGVCGLALTPSVALGGYLMKSANFSMYKPGNDHSHTTDDDPNDVIKRYIPYYSHIKHFFQFIRDWLHYNWKLLFFSISSLCFLISSICFIYLCILDYIAYHLKKRRRSGGRRSVRGGGGVGNGNTGRKLQSGGQNPNIANDMVPSENINNSNYNSNSNSRTSSRNSSINISSSSSSDAVDANGNKVYKSRSKKIRSSPMHLTYPQTALKLETARLLAPTPVIASAAVTATATGMSPSAPPATAAGGGGGYQALENTNFKSYQSI